MTEGYLTSLISPPTNGELALVIVLPPSASSTESSTTSSTTPVATTMDEGNVIGHAVRCESLRMELRNPNGGGEEDGDVELADDGSDSSSGDNARV